MWGTFTSSNSALLLIDHQVGTMKLIKNIPLEVVQRNAVALAKTAKVLGLPVVLTTSLEEEFQGPLMPELKEILPDAYAARVKRGGIVNAWNDPNFRASVERTQRRNLIMAGVTTNICLVFPALTARRDDYSDSVGSRWKMVSIQISLAEASQKMNDRIVRQLAGWQSPPEQTRESQSPSP